MLWLERNKTLKKKSKYIYKIIRKKKKTRMKETFQ